MGLQRAAASLGAGVALFASLWTTAWATPSYPVAYCASINTANMAANSSDFQSDGLCVDFCKARDNGYALAIVQEKNCWCSDYVPVSGDQVSTDNCENSCPGYPSDYCGGDSLYGYITLSKSASGTAGAGTAESTSSSVGTSATVTTATVTSSVHSVTDAESVQSTGQTTATSSDTSSISSTSSSANGGSSTQTPIVQTVTVGGTVKTVTATPTNPASSNSIGGASSSHSGLSSGATAGVVIAVVAAIAMIAFGFWAWCYRRKKQQKNEGDGPFESPSQRGSSAGMLGTPKTGDMSENRYTASDGRSVGESWAGNSRSVKAQSYLRPVDPRLDPYTGLYPGMQNKSRESVNSLQDHQDYSRRVHEPARVLRTTNPDPEED